MGKENVTTAKSKYDKQFWKKVGKIAVYVVIALIILSFLTHIDDFVRGWNSARG